MMTSNNKVGYNGENPNPYVYYTPGSNATFSSQLKLREALGSVVCKAGMHKWRGGDECIKCGVIRVENPGYTKRALPRGRSR